MVSHFKRVVLYIVILVKCLYLTYLKTIFTFVGKVGPYFLSAGEEVIYKHRSTYFLTGEGPDERVECLLHSTVFLLSSAGGGSPAESCFTEVRFEMHASTSGFFTFKEL